jgi:transposase
MTRRKFSREFKIVAAELVVTERSVLVIHIRRNPDLAESVLRRWMRAPLSTYPGNYQQRAELA